MLIDDLEEMLRIEVVRDVALHDDWALLMRASGTLVEKDEYSGDVANNSEIGGGGNHTGKRESETFFWGIKRFIERVGSGSGGEDLFFGNSGKCEEKVGRGVAESRLMCLGLQKKGHAVTWCRVVYDAVNCMSG